MGQIRQKGSLAIQRFLVALPVLLKYLAVTKILQVFVLFPGFWSLTQALSLSAGYATINNSNIAPFLLSAQGLVWIVVFIVFVFLTLIMEIGGYMMISAVKLHHKVEPSYMAILRSCFRVLPKVFGPGLIIVFIFNLVILPLAGTELNLSFMAGLRIPNFITSVINSNPVYYGAYIAVLLVVHVVVFFSVFIFHFMLLGGVKPLKAWKFSFALIWPRKVRFFFFILMNAAVGFLLMSILLTLVGLFSVIVGFLAPNTPQWNDTIYLIGLFIMALNYSAFSVMATPFFVFLLTDRYYIYLTEEAWKCTSNLEIVQARQVPYIPDKLRISLMDRLVKLTPIAAVLVLVSIVISSVFLAHNAEEFVTAPRIPVIGHRGGPGEESIENTLDAVRHSIDKRAEYVEVDVQRTADGYYILNHDDDFSRLAGVAKSSHELTLKEIQALDLGATSQGRFHNVKVPTVEELFSTAKGKIGIFLELKGPTADPQMVDDMVALIEEYGMRDSVVIMSLSYDIIDYVESRYPDMLSGFTYFLSFGDARNLQGDYLIMEEDAASRELVDTLHASGKKVAIWTLNEDDSMWKFVTWPIDGAITDYVSEWQEVSDQNKRRPPLVVLAEELLE